MKFKIILTAVVLFISLGCARTSVTMLDNTQRPPTENVRVYTDRDSIEKEYAEIALFNAEGGAGASPRKVMESMIDKAKKIGADAIILTGQGSKGNIMLTGEEAYGASVNVASAIAIVYKD